MYTSFANISKQAIKIHHRGIHHRILIYIIKDWFDFPTVYIYKHGLFDKLIPENMLACTYIPIILVTLLTIGFLINSVFGFLFSFGPGREKVIEWTLSSNFYKLYTILPSSKKQYI